MDATTNAVKNCQKRKCRGWSPKFATGLNIIIGIDQKIYETNLLPKWCSPRGIILQKDSLTTLIIFERCLL